MRCLYLHFQLVQQKQSTIQPPSVFLRSVFPRSEFLRLASNSHDSHTSTPPSTFQTLFPLTLTWAAWRSLNVCFSWGGTCVGPRIRVVVTVSSSNVGMFTAGSGGTLGRGTSRLGALGDHFEGAHAQVELPRVGAPGAGGGRLAGGVGGLGVLDEVEDGLLEVVW
jgi:hypothetical protein